MNEARSPAQPKRRGTRGGRLFLVIFGTWIVVYFAARAVLEHKGLFLPVRLAIAIMPVAVLSGVITAAIALPLTAVTALAIGMLRHAGIVAGATDLWPFHHMFLFQWLCHRALPLPPRRGIGTERRKGMEGMGGMKNRRKVLRAARDGSQQDLAIA
jgi:hypothetical protein